MKIDEATYKAMPVELQALFRKMPNPSSDEVVGLFPVTGPSKATPRNNGEFKSVAKGRDLPHVTHGHDDAGGSAARFFYCAKASKRDRDEGCEGMEPRLAGVMNMRSDNHAQATGNIFAPKSNHHPTVKPTDLMRYLCRLVTPPGGVVLDPFMGSGSTGKGAVLEGFNFIGIEQNAEYIKIAKARIAFARTQVEQEPAKVGNLQTSLFNADE
jgi:site-specific DNA-methyltransferase (adenine-specific)